MPGALRAAQCAFRKPTSARRGRRNQANWLTQGSQARALQVIAVEEIVSIEGNQAAVWMHDMDTSLLDRPNIKSVGIDELDNEYAKNILIGEISGGSDAGKAAQKFAQRSGA